MKTLYRYSGAMRVEIGEAVHHGHGSITQVQNQSTIRTLDGGSQTLDGLTEWSGSVELDHAAAFAAFDAREFVVSTDERTGRALASRSAGTTVHFLGGNDLEPIGA